MPVYIIKCPKCLTKYKISSERIASGTKVKCKKCGAIFIIRLPEKKRVEPEKKETVKEEKITLEVPPDVPPEERKLHERAIRIAKILAKDIINYYRERWERALREDNLREEFKKEILESWKYYCEKIPPEIREKTRYFQDAFNLIVGKGKRFL